MGDIMKLASDDEHGEELLSSPTSALVTAKIDRDDEKEYEEQKEDGIIADADVSSSSSSSSSERNGTSSTRDGEDGEDGDDDENDDDEDEENEEYDENDENASDKVVSPSMLLSEDMAVPGLMPSDDEEVREDTNIMRGDMGCDVGVGDGDGDGDGDGGCVDGFSVPQEQREKEAQEIDCESQKEKKTEEEEQQQQQQQQQHQHQQQPPSSSQPSSSQPSSSQPSSLQQSQQQQQPPPPEPKFHARQRTFARDSMSGLLYEAIIRRAMYGVNHHRQVQVKECSPFRSLREVEEFINCEPAPTWHYFVHYTGWNVKWDRWVSEEDIFEPTDAIRRLAKRMNEEVKSIRTDLLRRRRASKPSQAQITAELERRLTRLKREEPRLESDGNGVRGGGGVGVGVGVGPVHGHQNDDHEDNTNTTVDDDDGDGDDDNDPDGSNKKQKNRPQPPSKANVASRGGAGAGTGTGTVKLKSSGSKPNSSSNGTTTTTTTIRNRWNKERIQKELVLRKRSLQGRRKQAHANLLVLPFPLKKILVEEWELITQCQMLPRLPAAISVRKALEQYRQSKLGFMSSSSSSSIAPAAEAATVGSIHQPPLAEEMDQEKERQQPKPPQPPQEQKQEHPMNEDDEEWRVMIDGIATFFDQALASRLLYPQEQEQYAALVHAPTRANNEMAEEEREMEGKSNDDKIPRWTVPSELYGCEYLLRMCVRLPTLVAEAMEKQQQQQQQKRHHHDGNSDDDDDDDDHSHNHNKMEQWRSVLSKVNDLVRFLHKHQTSFFAQSYQKAEKTATSSSLLNEKKGKGVVANGRAGSRGKKSPRSASSSSASSSYEVGIKKKRKQNHG